MKIGASTKSFGGKRTREVAELFGENGLSAIELCFCQNDLSGFRYNLCGKADLPCISEAQAAKEIYNGYGIEICSIGVYCNFWCGTYREIFDTFHLFTKYCDIAYALGVKTLATHTGSVFAMPASRGFSTDLSEKLYQGFTHAAIEAHKRGLTIAVEVDEKDAIACYGQYLELKKRVFDNIGVDVLKMIYSPGMENGEISAPEIAVCHIKDKKNGGKFYERYGAGDMDYSGFFKAFGKNEDIPMILEYVNSENLGETVNRFRGAVAGKQ